ncbi:hypothetical protein PAHAL_1G038600 [Panicum hallii]|uniref:Uncharacterized protein n=1 Tax=Panicum hallii TaxID=206008 RepID=A0A2T8KTX6_9POAL|nr:hypothetical protein PAHAL_1G038600 [Panicum hallii]
MLRAARFFMLPNVVDGKYPVNKLLEILITFILLSGVDCSSWNSPLSLLKLTSRTIMLLDSSSSSGNPPESELPERLSLNRLVRLPSEGDMCPSRPREAIEMSMTAPSILQMMPSHKQQFVSFCHEVGRPEF